jgi:hypothetical protein
MATRSQILKSAREIGAHPEFLELAKSRHPEAFREWDRIMSGDVKRNDAVVIAAIKLLWQFSEPLPKQVVEHQGAVGIQVIDPYAEDREEIDITVPAAPVLPPVAAKPPILRKRSKPAEVPAP